MRILAYYGGSFNPPHSGHQRVVLEALVHSGADEVWIAPVYTHPDGKKLAPYNDRIAMCHELTRPFKGYDVSVSRVEERLCQAGGKGLTADIVESLTAGDVFDKVFLVAGHDVALALAKWEGYDRLLKLQAAGKFDLFLVTRDTHYSVDPMNTSSTSVRLRVALGEDLGRLVPPGVERYITKYNLYKE
jgi:nicotinate-nucleotide adenylyltransferase